MSSSKVFSNGLECKELNTPIYNLTGQDVISVLKELNREDIIEDQKKLNMVIDFLLEKLDITWEKYIKTLISARLGIEI